MDLRRTPLLLETAVPVDWPKKVGFPPPGTIRKTAYPAGQPRAEAGYDDEYPDTPEGRKIAKAHAWQFPSKRIKVGSKILRY